MRNRSLRKAFLLSLVFAAFLPLVSVGQGSVSYEIARDHFKKGVILFNNYSYLGSVEFFRTALTVYPEYHQAREYLARAYRLAGYTDAALREWEYLFDISNDASVQNKIDMLRYHRVYPMQPPMETEFTHVKNLESRELRSYHFRYPTDTSVDSEKNIYIVSFNSGRVVKINDSGEGLDTYKPALESRLYGLDIKDNFLLFSDFARDIVYCTDLNFNEKFSFGGSGAGDGQFRGPQGVCFDDNSGIFVVDSGNHRVQLFSKEGKFILQFGKKGNYDGEFQNPTDVAFLDKLVYVTDTGNSRVSVYDTSGNFIRNITNAAIKSPRGISVNRDKIIVSDSLEGLIIINPKTDSLTVFDSWGENNQNGFSRLYSAVFDRDDFLYALDHDKERLSVFSPVQKRYTNLDIEIKSVDISNYPTVAFYVSVRDRTGDPVYALKSEEFYVTEDSARIQSVSINYLKDKPASSTMIFCVDRSEGMDQWKEELVWSADFILTEMKKSDSVKVFDFSDDYITANDYDWSRRRIQKALRDGIYGGSKNIGRVIYNAVSELLKTDSKRAVVLFTDGIVSEDSFEQYSENIIIDYARCHYVPVYIVSLSGSNPVLQDICDKTGGMFIEARKVSDLRMIYQLIRKQEEYRYVVVYKSLRKPHYSGWWSNVSIEVESKGERGVEWGGYYIP
ncbi:MAG: VWA domain-containing protein [Spirochaetes bacterium]|nr:VWA domain-containing protein [Spirochaetota bacterium]